jgi:hypothetical protein
MVCVYIIFILLSLSNVSTPDDHYKIVLDTVTPAFEEDVILTTTNDSIKTDTQPDIVPPPVQPEPPTPKTTSIGIKIVSGVTAAIVFCILYKVAWYVYGRLYPSEYIISHVHWNFEDYSDSLTDSE